MPLATGGLAFLLAVAMTAVYLPLARGQRWLDEPNHRSAHSDRVPSSGGIAVVVALLVAVGLYLLRDVDASAGVPYLMFLLLAVLCAVGAWDDRAAMPVGPRLTLFLLIALACVTYYLPGSGPGWLVTLAVATLALAWLLNLYNFMDGIDGIAAVQCVLVSIPLAIIAGLGGAPPLFSALALAAAGAYGGFLLFNWPRASLFMGDAGSLCAGFLLGWLGLWGAVDGWVPGISWCILMSPFLVDTGFTLLRRARRRERLTQAHNEHLYQRLARHWQSHRAVDLALVALQLGWLIPLALAHALLALPGWLALGLALLLQGGVVAKTARLQ